MNWKDYEKEVHAYYLRMYPNAHITHNARIVGRYSGKKRQIDILIEDDVADYPIKIVIDTKYRSRKIDVGCVESFISMIKDVEANRGVMIASKGYSEAAIQRAYKDSRSIELDILNFDELLKNQGRCGIPYSGKRSIFLHAPMGWVVDNSKLGFGLACLYQRGLSIETAMKNKEFGYLNFWHKDKDAQSIFELAEMQNEGMRNHYTNLCIGETRAPKRDDQRDTYIRVASSDELPFLEVTGFIDCDDFIVFFVLFTRKEFKDKNMRKLKCILKYSMPFKMNFDNTKVIKQLKNECKSIEDPTKKAQSYAQIAEWYAEMDNADKAMEYRRLCWKTYPEIYENIEPLIRGELGFGNYDAAMNYSIGFFSLAPKNPRVMRDMLSIYDDSKYLDMFDRLIKQLRVNYCNDNEVLGNINFHHGIYFSVAGNDKKALEKFELAKRLFILVDKKHDAIDKAEKCIEELHGGQT